MGAGDRIEDCVAHLGVNECICIVEYVQAKSDPRLSNVAWISRKDGNDGGYVVGGYSGIVNT